jgi:histidinol dehydrogenase
MKILHAHQVGEDFFKHKETNDISIIRYIIKDVKETGDEALKRYTSRFDGVLLQSIGVTQDEIKHAYSQVSDALIQSIKKSQDNIVRFAQRQLQQFTEFEFEIEPGIITGQKVIPIERVGVYVPGGRYPLVSSLLMCTLPAKVAGVKEIIICSPPSAQGLIHPAILVAADIVGINEVYQVGGAHAVAAMAYGTASIKRVDKIVGPGNKYVTMAKKEVFGLVGIDGVAGPTEIMIIADESAKADFIIADLLAQAEHDVDATPILVTSSMLIAEKVRTEIMLKAESLATKNTALKSLNANGVIIIVSSIEQAIDIANRRAPEHLELQVKNFDVFNGKLTNYGTLFVGEYSAEVLGDYSSGLNHTLPTNFSARYSSGLSVKDFIKMPTTLKVTKTGFLSLGKTAHDLALLEGLAGHAHSIDVRQ